LPFASSSIVNIEVAIGNNSSLQKMRAPYGPSLAARLAREGRLLDAARNLKHQTALSVALTRPEGRALFGLDSTQ
jgi:hypothetical protein